MVLVMEDVTKTNDYLKFEIPFYIYLKVKKN